MNVGEADEAVAMVSATVTCPTAGCDNEGVPIVIDIPEALPHVICGPCGTPVPVENVIEDEEA